MRVGQKIVLGATAVTIISIGVILTLEKQPQSMTTSASVDHSGDSHTNMARQPVLLSQFHPDQSGSKDGPEDDAGADILARAREYSEGRYNIFFDEQQFIKDLLADSESVEQLRAQLLAMEKLKALPEGVRYLTDQPSEVIDRINALDLLLDMAKTDARAQRVVEELTLARLDNELPVHVQRVVMAEKYEMLEELAANDWEAAAVIYDELGDESMQEILQPALHAGLYARGLTDEEARLHLNSQI